MTKTEELLKLAEEAAHAPDGQWHWNDKYGELCYKSEADDQSYMMSCPLPLNESNSRFIAAANPQTIKQLVALARLQHEVLKINRGTLIEVSPCMHPECQQVQVETMEYSEKRNAEAIEAFEKFERNE